MDTGTLEQQLAIIGESIREARRRALMGEDARREQSYLYDRYVATLAALTTVRDIIVKRELVA